MKFRIDNSDLKKRIPKILAKLEKGAQVTTREVAIFTRDRIRYWMPKDTKESAASINYLVTKNDSGIKEVIVTEKVLAHKDKAPFDLPVWMFNSSNALNHFRTGNIEAMRNVDEQAENIFLIKINNTLKTIDR